MITKLGVNDPSSSMRRKKKKKIYIKLFFQEIRKNNDG